MPCLNWFQLYSHTLRKVLSEGDFVVLARSATTEEFTPLSSGIAIIAAHQPEILEQIRYLGTIGMCEAYLIERGEFIELLFDDRGLLHVFCAFLNQTTQKSGLRIRVIDNELKYG